jgi:hypothetical protein
LSPAQRAAVATEARTPSASTKVASYTAREWIPMVNVKP